MELSKTMLCAGFQPVMWIGDPAHTKDVEKNYPDCTVYDLRAFNKAETLKRPDNKHALPLFVLQDQGFYKLKDQVLKMMDRQDDHGSFRRLEREALFYAMVTYFYSEIKKHDLDFVLSAEGPHSPSQMIIYKLCEIMGIQRIHFMTSNIAPFLLMRTSVENADVLPIDDQGRDLSMLKALVRDYVYGFRDDGQPMAEPLYIKLQRDKEQAVKLSKSTGFLSAPVKRMKSIAKRYLRNKRGDDWRSSTIKSLNFLDESLTADRNDVQARKTYTRKIHKMLRDEYDAVTVPWERGKPYVYFPLHYEPERTTNPDGGAFYQTYDTLMALRDMVPNEIPIYIKEHYSQFSSAMKGYRGKSHYFYRSLKALPNIYVLKSEESSGELIRGALLTASITGTPALEAACMGKKALIFGHTWFSNCPNIYSFDPHLGYEDILSAPVHDKQAITAFFDGLIDGFAVRGCINQSNDAYYTKKLGQENADMLLQDGEMISDIMRGLRGLKFKGRQGPI